MTASARHGSLSVESLPAQLALAVGWAVLFVAVFPPLDLWLAAHVALVPLSLLAVLGRTRRRMAAVVYVTAYFMWLVLAHWLKHVTLPGYFVLCAYLSLYPWGYALVLRSVCRRRGVPMVLAVPIIWVGFEYVRGWMIDGFPWFLLGHSQPTVMIQIADVFGAYGVSFVTAMSSGLMCDLLLRPMYVRTTGRKRFGVPVRWSLPLWAAATVGSIAYGIVQINGFDDLLKQSDPPPPSVRIAVVQTNVPQSNKINPTDEQTNADFDLAMKLTTQAALMRPDLIAWPETMVPRPINDDSYTLFTQLRPSWAAFRDRLDEFVVLHRIPLLVGAHAMIDWKPAEEGGYRPTHRTNAAYLITAPADASSGPAAVTRQRYDKIHRVPFGEYIPWVDTLPWLKDVLFQLTPYKAEYILKPGTTWVVFDVSRNEREPLRIATPICYEDVVTYPPRQMVYHEGVKRVDVLVNMSNDGWYAGTPEAAQHEQLARFRCVENRVPMARAVNGGISGFIDSVGRITGRVEVDGATQQVAGYAVGELHFDPRHTMFGRVGDVFAAACMALTILFVAANLTLKRLNRR